MQSVYRVIQRDYKHSYNYFTKRKDIFDLFANGDGVSTPEMPRELAAKYGYPDSDETWEFLDEIPAPQFPYILLGETTQYTA